jgi:hypothetical protein
MFGTNNHWYSMLLDMKMYGYTEWENFISKSTDQKYNNDNLILKQILIPKVKARKYVIILNSASIIIEINGQ